MNTLFTTKELKILSKSSKKANKLIKKGDIQSFVELGEEQLAFIESAQGLDNEVTSQILVSLGTHYMYELNNKEKALKHLLNAEKVHEKLGNEREHVMFVIYDTLSEIYCQLNDREKTQHYMLKIYNHPMAPLEFKNEMEGLGIPLN
jgi:hypothetical protein